MSEISKSIFCILLIALTNYSLKAQTISERSWKSVATNMPDEWYGSEESKSVADNVLLYQRNAGGWPKNIPMQKSLSSEEKTVLLKDKNNRDATLDNSATTTEMIFLARMYNKTGTEKYKKAFAKGLDYILEAQYDNGGWPQFYPLRKGYYTHITFNDDAIVNIMELLKDIMNKKPLYAFVESDDIVSKVKRAFSKGIDCILRTQIIVKGKPTVWCAQHDEKTMLPAGARSYELPSFSGAESAGIVNLLMELPDPTPGIIRSVQCAVEWFDQHKLKNVKWEYFVNSDGLRDRKIVHDNSAGSLWARFYDLETELPFVCDRDGIKKERLEEIGYERRNGYSWYTDSPKTVLEAYPGWKSKWLK